MLDYAAAAILLDVVYALPPPRTMPLLFFLHAPCCHADAAIISLVCRRAH